MTHKAPPLPLGRWTIVVAPHTDRDSMPTARPHAKFVVLAYQLTSIMVRLVRSESEAAVRPVWPSRLVASLAAEAPVMRRIAIALSKGGVGKSTTAVSVAAGLARAGARVLLIDTDTQGQVSGMLGRHPTAGLAELLAGEQRPEEAIVEAREQLWLLAGGRTLAGMKRLIGRKDFGGEQTLGDTLAPLEGRYDYIILDTAPGWDVLSVNVLFYAAEILAPIALEVLSLQSLLDFQKSLAAIQRYNSASPSATSCPLSSTGGCGSPPNSWHNSARTSAHSSARRSATTCA